MAKLANKIDELFEKHPIISVSVLIALLIGFIIFGKMTGFKPYML